MRITWSSNGSFVNASSARRLLPSAYLASLTPSKYSDLVSRGLRIDPRSAAGGQAQAGLDLEPAGLTLSDDGHTGYVSMQVGRLLATACMHTMHEPPYDPFM